MKSLVIALTLSTAVVMPAFANKDLANKNACLACHAVDKKLLGPAYLDVAKKYAKEKDAATKLATSIKAGGSGKWGAIPMPAQETLKPEDALTLAKWILDGAKDK